MTDEGTPENGINETDDEKRKSFIPISNVEPVMQPGNQEASYYQPITGTVQASGGMQELQQYLIPDAALKNASAANIASEQETAGTQGGAKGTVLNKRSEIESVEERRKSKFSNQGL